MSTFYLSGQFSCEKPLFFQIFQSTFKLLASVFFLSIFAAASFGQTVAASQTPHLKLGVPVEGSFASGETQTFALHLESNQFAAVVLNQKGVNLVLAVDDAKDGRRLLEVDVNYGDFGYDRALIASGDEPRDLLIRARPLQKEKAADTKFSIALVELKPAEARDKQRIAAQTAILDGIKAFYENNKESRFKGFFLLAGSLKTAREIQDPILEATGLILMQKAYIFLGDLPKVIEYGEMALPLLNSPENAYFQLIVKDSMGKALVNMNEEKRGIEVISEVLAAAEKLDDRRLMMICYINLGFANLRTQNLARNIEYAERAFQIAKDLNIGFSQTESLRLMSATYHRFNDFNKAIEFSNKAMVKAKEFKLENFILSINSDLADNFVELGQLQKALDHYHQALDINKRIQSSKNIEAGILASIASCYSSLGQNARALEYRQRALDMLNELGYKDAIVRGLMAKGVNYLSLKDLEKAKESFNEALKLAEQQQSSILKTHAYTYLGLTEKAFNRPEAALEYHLKAEQMRSESKIKSSESSSLNGISDAYILLGQYEKSADYAAKALEISRTTGDRLTESNALFNLARARRGQKESLAALRLVEDSLKIVEAIRAELINQESRTAYLSTVRDKYDFYISLLIELQEQPENKPFGAAAFAASERARARGLLDLLAESYTDVSAGVAPELRTRERGIQAKLSSLQTKLIQLKTAEKQDDKRIIELQKAIGEADLEREKLESEIRRANPRYAALKYPATVDLKQTQAILDEKTVLLEYQIGANGAFLFAVGKNEFQIVKLPNEKKLRESVETLHRSLSTPARTNLANYLATGRELYTALVAPIENLLKTKTKIIVAADGALNYLPFETLLRNDQTASLDKLPYLVRDFEISYTPSASILANLKSYENTAKPPKAFVAFAAPDYAAQTANQNQLTAQTTRSIFGENRVWRLTDLQFARSEATQIAKLFPAGQATVFTGAEATETRVKQTDFLSQYRYLHFAVHGLIDEEQPQFSSLVLSLPKANNQAASQNAIPNENPKSEIRNPNFEEDGLLQTPEIFNLRLRADLVTLSACETGLGQEMSGEGIVGLTRAFFYAGTPSVLVSLWKVDDASTADLMTLFYENLRKTDGREKSAALRETQLKLIGANRYAHPYYWASFILQGKTNSNF